MSGLVASHFVSSAPGEARRAACSFRSRLRQIVGDALLVLVQRVGARRVASPRTSPARESAASANCARVRVARLPRPVRRLVVHHQEERLVARPRLEEVERQVGDDVGGVAARVGLLAGRRVEHRIDVGALAGQDLPAIEAGRIAAEVPLADHAGVVAALLQQPRHRHARAVEAVEHRHAVEVRVLAGEDRGAARRADRVGGEDARQQRALARQPIEVRRLVDARPVGADRVRRVIVGHDEDDVGAVGAWGLRHRGRGQKGGDDPEARRSQDPPVRLKPDASLAFMSAPLSRQRPDEGEGGAGAGGLEPELHLSCRNSSPSEQKHGGRRQAAPVELFALELAARAIRRGAARRR